MTRRFQIVVVGAGAAGEAAAQYAATRGATVAIIDRELFGGSCPFWACMPSKALLHAAQLHRAGGDYPWPRASAFRDYMINRQQRDWPDDSGHVEALESAGATVIRGTASFAGPGRLTVETDDGTVDLQADAVVVAIGSHSHIPDLPGLAEAGAWTNREGTSTRELPVSLAIMGGGPTGVELAQVYARYAVPTTIIHPRDRLLDREHPRSSEFLRRGLERDGVKFRLGVRAVAVQAAGSAGAAHRVLLSDGSGLDAHALLLAIGREVPLDDLNLAAIGVEVRDGRVRNDNLQIADNVYVAGDIAGPELHTHLAHYQGELAARRALGESSVPDYSAIPRATYTDPETASVGLLLEQARERAMDAVELTADLATSAKGYVAEAEGHVTIVVDRTARVLVGAFMAGPAVSETIHECVLAVKTRTPLDVLADTIHAFPTVARVLGSLFIRAAREL
jgi:pyruvate/2-oxoglutarate dehydrogenase complex dihydrolipoamide dehydrogenase (E3) component